MSSQLKIKLKNKFGISEWSGAFGDLGTSLPFIFALVAVNGFPAERIFFLWGTAYVFTGWYYKVPVSVQPLKAMAVIAIANNFSIEMLSTTALLFGILFVFLSFTGIIEWLRKWFSQAIVGGIQLGLSLILAYKAFELVWQKGFLLHADILSNELSVVILILLVLFIWYFQLKKNLPISLITIAASIVISVFLGYVPELSSKESQLFYFTPPQLSFFLDSLILLMIPQLPLTLGNAVYSADDICHKLWKEQAANVSPKKLAASLGFSNIGISLLGGFPICHGAGGMGAHAQFGAKTGGATIIMGGVFILVGLVTPLSNLLFIIPVPLLSAMLVFNSWVMGKLILKLKTKAEIYIALIVGVLSFLTNNLAIALALGIAVELIHKIYLKKYK